MGKDSPGETLHHNGCDLHYWIDGPSGVPVVVFSHGAGTNHSMFDDQVDAVAHHYRMLRWDMRGHGLSRPANPPFNCKRAAQDLAALLDYLGEYEIALVGQSIGGNVAQEFIFLYPERCKAALFLGCTCNTWRLSWRDKLLLRIAPILLEMYPSRVLRKTIALSSAVTHESRERLLEMTAPLNGHEIASIFSEIVRDLHPENGYKIRCPIEIAYGVSDRLGNIKKIAAAWAKRDGAPPPIVIPDAGHCANMDNPAVFNRLMMMFLATHYPVDSARSI